jgi:hypothetical protein
MLHNRIYLLLNRESLREALLLSSYFFASGTVVYWWGSVGGGLEDEWGSVGEGVEEELRCVGDPLHRTSIVECFTAGGARTDAVFVFGA